MRAVMRKVEANLQTMVQRGLITPERAVKWSWALIYTQLRCALNSFEVQFAVGAQPIGLRYEISADGAVRDDANSGGLDVYGIPGGTPTSIVLSLKDDAPQDVYDELGRRGWGTDGRLLSGALSERRAFSSDGYGIVRHHVGEWL